jgi:hypothetical protein
MTVEDDRAAEYRRKMVARIVNKKRLERALTGDPEAATALRAAWEPIRPGQCIPKIGENQ